MNALINNMKYFIGVLAVLIFASCQEKPATEMRWVHTKTIQLDGINPIGIAKGDDGIWLSDGDHNRVVLVDEEGVFQKSIDSLDRPMHIDHSDGRLFIPQYGNDEVVDYDYSSEENILPNIVRSADSLDAPAGVSKIGSEFAIADFYKNRIHYSNNGTNWITFGKEGNADGDFYYPTDVQITKEKIWVADAYNNRLQVFDKKGKHLNTIGVDQKMNAATGIFVTESEVFSTDFENDRVLVFDLDGAYKQELKESISKPTDMMVIDRLLYVTNYKGKSLSVFELKEVEVTFQDGDEHTDDHEHNDHHEEHQ